MWAKINFYFLSSLPRISARVIDLLKAQGEMMRKCGGAREVHSAKEWENHRVSKTKWGCWIASWKCNLEDGRWPTEALCDLYINHWIPLTIGFQLSKIKRSLEGMSKGNNKGSKFRVPSVKGKRKKIKSMVKWQQQFRSRSWVQFYKQ